MNTIEQARDVSSRLAERARRLSRTLKMRPRVGLEEESADTIDALLAENAALLAANRDCINHFDQIKEDYDKAVVELGATRRDRNELGDEEDVARQRYERAEAELDALKSQEPVAWGQLDAVGNIIESISPEEKTGEMKGWAAQYTAPLYLAAGAQPVQQEFEQWRRALAKKVDIYIQGEYDGEGAGDEAYTDLKAHILSVPVAQPVQEKPIRELSDGETYSRVSQFAAERAGVQEREHTLYNELIFAVGKKYPGETRHETALRYIRQAEAPTREIAKEQP